MCEFGCSAKLRRLRLKSYLNLNGNSGIRKYDIGQDWIRLQFQSPTIYVYDYQRPGKDHVDRMKVLALSGRGLDTYVSQDVRGAYSRKEVEFKQ